MYQGTHVTPFPDVEPSKICNGDTSCYDPSVLNLLDEFMLDAHNYGVKVRLSSLSLALSYTRYAAADSHLQPPA